MNRFASHVTRHRVILAAIVLLAAVFRFYRLDRLPPGFEFDVAFKVFDILRLLQGQFAIFFPAYTGREPFYHYLSIVYVSLFGPTAFSLKLSAAIIGTATVPIFYGFVRTFFGSFRIAALAALFMAISFWHVFFSRVGYRVILLVPIAILMFWWLWRALGSRRSPNWRAWAFTGLFDAIALYLYPSSRVFPLILIVLAVYGAVRERPRGRQVLRGLGLSLAVTALLFLPLGTYFALHPDQFIGHPADVSIFAQHGNMAVDVPAALASNAIKLLGMFFVAGDTSALRNWSALPVFDPFLALLFLAGVVAAGLALLWTHSSEVDRRRAVFILVWIGAAMGISLFSDDAPEFSRTLFALPAILILPAWGASALWERLSSPLTQRAALGALAVIVAASAGLTFQEYFVGLANDPGTFYAFDTDKVEISDWINQTAKTEHILIAPLLQQNGTISLLTHLTPLRTFDSRDTVVLPSRAAGMDAVYAFPPEQETKAQTLASRLGSVGALEQINGSNGAELLRLYHIPAANLPDLRDPAAALAQAGPFVRPQSTSDADWSGLFKLIGYSVDAPDSAKRNIEVTLMVLTLKPVSADYTFSIKVRDAQDRVWGQQDKWPGDNSYASTEWRPGDLIVEKFYTGLDPCAPAGAYAVTAEAYDPKTGAVLGLAGDAGSVVDLGTWQAEASQSNRLEDLQPDQAVDHNLGNGLNLIGYTLTPGQVRPGDKVSLSLFWRGIGAGATRPVTVTLQDASQSRAVLANGPVSVPADGRGLCSFYDLSVPSSAPSGAGSILVNDVKIAGIDVTK